MTLHEFGNENAATVLLIHPSCVMWDYFEYVIPLMQDRYHLIVPALPGYDEDEKDDFTSVEQIASELADRNPYSWNMEYLPYPDGSGFEARFSRCGICTLMTELGLREMIPAMCRLDYTMSEAGGADRFVRQYTLASGGPYCDCGYKKIRR